MGPSVKSTRLLSVTISEYPQMYEFEAEAARCQEPTSAGGCPLAQTLEARNRAAHSGRPSTSWVREVRAAHRSGRGCVCRCVGINCGTVIGNLFRFRREPETEVDKPR